MKTASISLILSIFLISLIHTWFSESTSDSEVLLESHFNVVARSDHSKWDHGGFSLLLIPSKHK